MRGGRVDGLGAAVPRRWNTLLAAVVAGVMILAMPALGRSAAQPPAVGEGAYATTLDYVIRFYPRFFTYFQQSVGKSNRLSGPVRMGPRYGIVNAPNDDTVYAEFFLDLSKGPQVFTIPATKVTYSLETVDVWGNVLQTSITAHTPGSYALVPKGWQGTLPSGVTEVQVPYRLTVWFVRADKYSSSGQNMTAAARAFRASLRLSSLAEYRKDPSTGATQLLPLVLFSPQIKTIADETIELRPTSFLRQLQRALQSPTTSPLTESDRRLSGAFNRAFAAANQAVSRGNYGPLSQIVHATQTAHAMIVNRWQSHVDRNRWVYFGNIGQWGTAYLDRAALTEHMQYDNSAATARYYNAFTDDLGIPLNGSVVPVYRLRFSKREIPQATRFWSLTCYIPPGITLFPNPQNKWVVASYTPGLRKNRDGSITIYIQPRRPLGAPSANWLPVPAGPFSLVLRVYGPTGNTATGNYVPPPIRPLGLPAA